MKKILALPIILLAIALFSLLSINLVSAANASFTVQANLSNYVYTSTIHFNVNVTFQTTLNDSNTTNMTVYQAGTRICSDTNWTSPLDSVGVIVFGTNCSNETPLTEGNLSYGIILTYSNGTDNDNVQVKQLNQTNLTLVFDGTPPTSTPIVEGSLTIEEGDRFVGKCSFYDFIDSEDRTGMKNNITWTATDGTNTSKSGTGNSNSIVVMGSDTEIKNGVKTAYLTCSADDDRPDTTMTPVSTRQAVTIEFRSTMSSPAYRASALEVAEKPKIADIFASIGNFFTKFYNSIISLFKKG